MRSTLIWLMEEKKLNTASRFRLACLFLLPALVVFTFFKWLPILSCFILSFLKWDILTPPQFLGFGNWRNFFIDPFLWKYIKNSLYYPVFTVLIGLFPPILIAAMLSQVRKGRGVLRKCYLLPVAVLSVGVSLIWRWMYNPDFGLINYWLGKLGIDGPQWLSSIAWAKISIVLVIIWRYLGVGILIYVAALKSIPEKLHKQASEKGLNVWQTFWQVTLPYLKTPMIIICLLILGTFAFLFTPVYMMTAGGPSGATMNLSHYIYNTAYQWFKVGYAGTVSSFLIIILVFLGLAIKKIAENEHLGISFLQKEESKPAIRHTTGFCSVLIYVILILIAFACVLPFLWSVSTSLKDPGDIFCYPLKWAGKPFLWRNYSDVWRALPFGRAYFNSLLVAAAVCLIQIPISFCAAYAISIWKIKRSKILFLLFAATMLISPGAGIHLPIFIGTLYPEKILNFLFGTSFWSRPLHLGKHLMGMPVGIDSYFALIAPYLASGWAIFLFKLFLDRLNPLLAEVRTREFSEWAVFRRTALPKSLSMILLVAALTFLLRWNQFAWPLVVTNSESMMTLPIMLASFTGLYITDWHLLMAGVSISSFIIIIFFLAFENRFLGNLQLSSAWQPIIDKKRFISRCLIALVLISAFLCLMVNRSQMEGAKYKEGLMALNEKEYERAMEKFQEVIQEYPRSRWADLSEDRIKELQTKPYETNP